MPPDQNSATQTDFLMVTEKPRLTAMETDFPTETDSAKAMVHC